MAIVLSFSPRAMALASFCRPLTPASIMSLMFPPRNVLSGAMMMLPSGPYTAKKLLPAGVSAVSGEDLPQAFALHSAVPNPFNPSTTLRFDLPCAANVELQIYDVAGRLIRHLITTEAYPAGRHQAEWRGRDDSGKHMSAGVYLARLRADGQDRIVRMLLLK